MKLETAFKSLLANGQLTLASRHRFSQNLYRIIRITTINIAINYYNLFIIFFFFSQKVQKRSEIFGYSENSPVSAKTCSC